MSDPIIYGSIYPILLSDKLTAQKLTPLDIKANNLFFESIEFMMKMVDSTFSSQNLKKKVDCCLIENRYDYEKAKKTLLTDLPNVLNFKAKEASKIGLSDSPENLLYLETIEKMFIMLVDYKGIPKEAIKQKVNDYLTLCDNNYGEAKKRLFTDIESLTKKF